jgi:hypothetical protein
MNTYSPATGQVLRVNTLPITLPPLVEGEDPRVFTTSDVTLTQPVIRIETAKTDGGPGPAYQVSDYKSLTATFIGFEGDKPPQNNEVFTFTPIGFATPVTFVTGEISTPTRVRQNVTYTVQAKSVHA